MTTSSWSFLPGAPGGVPTQLEAWLPKKTLAKVWRLEGWMEPQESRGQHSVLPRQARQVVKAKSLSRVHLLVALRPRQDIQPDR